MENSLMSNVDGGLTIDNEAFVVVSPPRKMPKFKIEMVDGNKVFTPSKPSPLTPSLSSTSQLMSNENSSSSINALHERGFRAASEKLKQKKTDMEHDDSVTATVEMQDRRSTKQSQKRPKKKANQDVRRLKPKTKSAGELEIAATHLKDAFHGRQPVAKRDLSFIRRYNRFYSASLGWIQMLIFGIYLGLIFFEKPAVYAISPAFTVPVETLCVLFFMWRTYEYYKLTPSTNFWKEGKARALVIINILTFLDIVLHTVTFSVGYEAIPRWSRVIRPLFIINLSLYRSLRQAFRSVRKTIWAILHVMTLLFISMFLFAILFKELFEAKEIVDKSGNIYFEGYGDSMWNLYVTLSTSNFPDVMMPGWYEYGVGVPLLFMSFLLITKYVLEGILLAVVYQNYSLYMQQDTKKMLQDRKENLTLCFEKIANNSPTITFVEWSLLLESFGSKKEFTHGRMWLLWCGLDSENVGSVNVEQFQQTISVLMCSYDSVSSQQNVFTRHIPKVYNSKMSTRLRNMVKHRGFEWVFNIVIVITIVFMIADVEHIALDTAFIALFSVEILLKVYALGFRNFSRSNWNKYDCFCVGGAIIGLAYTTLSEQENTTAVDFLITLRVFRLTRIINRFPRFRVIIDTISQIMPAISSYGVMIVLVFYSFSAVGMWAYGGLICTEGNFSNHTGSVFDVGSPYYLGLHHCNAQLEGSEYAGGGYYNNNFNDYMHATITLFELMVVNQWHVIVEGFAIVSGHVVLTRLFFIVFHLFVVVVMINIFMAFILEAFLHVMIDEKMRQDEADGTIATGDVELTIEARLQRIMKEEIETSPELSKEFSLIEIKKSRRLVVLVERMFATESTA
eukprot:m.242582 g.242582  ORF g.242582 m.242582 type:complete len:847 (-) comp33799_c0_seq2:1270-3810(-)